MNLVFASHYDLISSFYLWLVGPTTQVTTFYMLFMVGRSNDPSGDSYVSRSTMKGQASAVNYDERPIFRWYH